MSEKQLRAEALNVFYVDLVSAPGVPWEYGLCGNHY